MVLVLKDSDWLIEFVWKKYLFWVVVGECLVRMGMGCGVFACRG